MITFFWNNGGPIALKHLLTPIYHSYFYKGERTIGMVYIFGIRIIAWNK